MGLEMECYLWDKSEESLLNDGSVIERVLEELPQVITKDHYNYQLEVRTKPHNNPDELLKELKANLKLADKVCEKYDLKIIPMSWMGGREMFNGVHMHFRNGDRNRFEQTLFNIYPFALALTDVFKFSPFSNANLSYRFRKSPHFAIPVLREMTKSKRYSDVCVNINKENNRHRLKSLNTIEIRTFDLPFDFNHLKNLVRCMFNIVAFIKNTSKIGVGGDFEEVNKKIIKTREEIKSRAVGYNYVLDNYNYEVYNWLCSKFNLEKLKLPFSIQNDWRIKDYVNKLDVKNYLDGGE